MHRGLQDVPGVSRFSISLTNSKRKSLESNAVIRKPVVGLSADGNESGNCMSHLHGRTIVQRTSLVNISKRKARLDACQ